MAARSGSTARSSRTTHAGRTAPEDIGIDALLADPATGIVVCCGSGGVGKTTTAAALGLRAAELPLGAIVVNQLRDPLLSDKAPRSVRSGRTAKLAEGVAADLATVGVKATAGVVTGLLTDAGQHADRVALEREQDAILAEQGRLTVRLPLLPEGTEGGGISVLADAVAEHGMI